MRISRRSSLAIFIFVFMSVRAAHASAVVSAGAQVDLTAVANAGIAFAATVLPILASVVVYLVSKFKTNATAKALVEEVLTHGASLAATKLGSVHIAHASLGVKNQAIGAALNYVVTAAGALLTAKGYDPTTAAGMEHIGSMIEARVPLAQAASGVTAAPIATATPLEAQPLITLGTALATDPHTVTTGEALAAAQAAISLVPQNDKQAAIAAAENALPVSLKGALGIAAAAVGA